MWISGRQNKYDVFWRLFECFEKSVGSSRCKHVNFVKQVNLSFAGATEGSVGCDFPDVGDIVVGGGVQLN